MAKTVSAEFKNHWTRKHGQRVRLSVQIQKRYQASPTSFVYTGTWEDLDTGRHFKEFPRFTKQLDFPFKNIFKTSTVTFTVANTMNEWIPSPAAPSIFAGDDTAPAGYFAPLTKFRFRYGYILPDDTTEWTTQFVGLLMDIKPRGRSPYADLIIASTMSVFEQLDIAPIADSFALEDCSPATGDGSTTSFKSTSKGVQRLTAVEVDAIPVTQGDFEISNVDDVDELDIEFRVPPAAGKTVKCSGTAWKKTLKIEDAVTLIFDEAGILPGSRIIDPAIFSGVGASNTWDTKAEWDAGTLTNIDTTTEDGSIIQRWALVDDFADGDFTSFRTWGNGFGDTTGWSVVSNALRAVGPTRDLYITAGVSPGDTGTWEFKLTSYTSGTVDFGFTAISDGGFFVNPPARLKHWLRIDPTSVKLYRGNGATSPTGSPTETLLGTSILTPTAGDIFRVSRDSSDEMKVYRNGGLLMTVTDAGEVGNLIRIRASAPGTAEFDDIWYTSEVVNEAHGATPSVWESDVVDVGSIPTSWGNLDRFEATTGAATIVYETLSADDALFASPDPSGWLAIGGSGQVLSALKQYIKVRVTITVEPFTETARVDKLVLNFQVTTVLLSVAIFRGKKGLQQLEEFARLANYVLGATDDDITFFRARSTAGSVLELDQENAIIDVLDWSPGWENVRNVGSVNYGDYLATYDKDDAGEAEPTSQRQFGRKVQSDDLSGLLLANDVAIGEARAEVIYNDLVQPKRRLRISAWFVPWLELDDVVTISYFDHPILKAFFWYDPLQTWGGDPWSSEEAKNVLARSLDMKILEIDQDPINANDGGGITATYTLEEVLV